MASAQDITPAVPVPEYQLAGYVLRLNNQGEQCVLEYKLQAEPSQMQQQKLAMQTPCHFLPWPSQVPAAANRAKSAGIALGSKGSARAWRYPSAKNVVVLAVLGDPQTDDPVFRQHAAHSTQCGSSLQAVLLTPTQLSLGPLEKHGRVQCAEYGMDEKRFWLRAHGPKE